MARITGIKYHKTTSGKLKSITIDLKKWGQYIEDFLDMIEIERIKSTTGTDDYFSHEQVKKSLERKHKIKL